MILPQVKLSWVVGCKKIVLAKKCRLDWAAFFVLPIAKIGLTYE